MLICADALDSRLFNRLFDNGVDITFIPTVSPYRPHETILEKYRRDDDIYVDGAQRSASYVVKACGVGSIFGNRLQGRSLIASPHGVLKRIEPQAEDSSDLLSYILDLDEIRDYAKKKRLIQETIGSAKSTE